MINKIKFNSIFARILKGIGYLVLLLLLVLGLKNELKGFIDAYLLPIFCFKSNLFLSLFFAAITLIIVVMIVARYVKFKKIFSLRDAFFLLLSLGIYCIFRCDGYYHFEEYWDCDVAYIDGFAFCTMLMLFIFVFQRVYLYRKNSSISSIECFITDLPIETYEEDIYGLEGVVKRIVKYVSQTDVSHHSFSMGLVGSWGEGKSSLMNLIRKELNNDKKYIVLDFNPRTSVDINHIQEDFFDSLRKALTPYHSGMRRTIAKYVDSINVVNDTPEWIKWLLNLVRRGSLKDISVSRQSLQEAIVDIDKKIVVFVDDLDRLTGKEILEVLKVIDRNGSFAGVYFLTAYDKNYVNEILKSETGAGNINNYSDKYFSVEVRLPAHPLFNIMDMLKSYLDHYIDNQILHISKDVVENTLQNCREQILKRIRMVRDVKRFVNQLIYGYVGVQEDVVFRDYLLLELIKFSHPDEYLALQHYEYIRPKYLDASEDLWYLKDEYIEKAGKGIEERKHDLPQSIDILRKLFPEGGSYSSWYKDRSNRIYSNSAFEFYFFNYEYPHLTQRQLTRLYDVSLSEACSIINDWPLEEKRDLTSYLLTRDVMGFNDQSKLQRYYQLALYSFTIIGNINYWSNLFGLVRINDVRETIERLQINDKEVYLIWLKDTFVPFLEFAPQVVSNFLIKTINYIIEAPSTESDLYMTLPELQRLSSQIAIKYLSMIDHPNWNSLQAFYLSQIQLDKQNLVPSVIKALRMSILYHFEHFSNNLVIVSKTNDDKGVATFQSVFQITKVYPEPHEFGELIHQKKFDKAPSIGLIRGLWPLYASNGFAPVYFNKGTNMDVARESAFREYLKMLATIKEFGQRIIDIQRKWNNGRGLLFLPTLQKNLSEIDANLRNIQLNIALKDKYISLIQSVSTQIDNQKLEILHLLSNELRHGDLVTICKESPSPKRPRIYPAYDVFTVDKVLSKDSIKLKEVVDPVPIADLRAIPIDEQAQDIIYYDPAPMVKTNKKQQDYIPFMEHFKSERDSKGVSYDVRVRKLKFIFVHEVQHWLQTFNKNLEVAHHRSAVANKNVRQSRKKKKG